MEDYDAAARQDRAQPVTLAVGWMVQESVKSGIVCVASPGLGGIGILHDRSVSSGQVFWCYVCADFPPIGHIVLTP